MNSSSFAVSSHAMLLFLFSNFEFYIRFSYFIIITVIVMNIIIWMMSLFVEEGVECRLIAD